MIVAKAPYRISFFGGGSDYPEWFNEHGGAFLSTAIDHFVFVSVRTKAPFTRNKYRILWRIVEEVENKADIQHPVVREALSLLDIKDCMDITYFGDLPSGTGMGSSSSFTVALLAALHASQNSQPNDLELANEAIKIEREKLNETVGIQDQIAAAFGGFNHVTIQPGGKFSITKVLLSSSRLKEFNDRLLLVYTGVTRHASVVAKSKVSNFDKTEKSIQRLQEMVTEGHQILEGNQNLDDFGKLLHEAWMQKRGLASSVTNDSINNLYEHGLKHGALGGKLLGAGGGGFMLFFVKEGMRSQLQKQLNNYAIVPLNVAAPGVTVSMQDTNTHAAQYQQIWDKSQFSSE
ncbi:kinase [Kiloniella litopenaei]|uniref:GHMP family kinase ATP-binding protein n=1 Tax=Kiloniella litopenaei TaxID=1549748 RepID=UPI003BAC9E81